MKEDLTYLLILDIMRAMVHDEMRAMVMNCQS